MITTFNPAVPTNNSNNALMAYLNPSTANTTLPVTQQTQQLTPTYRTSNLPSFTATNPSTTGTSIFANQVPPTGMNLQFAESPVPQNYGVVPPLSSGSGSGNPELQGLDQLLASANQYVTTIPSSSSAVASPTAIPTTAPRQASIPQASPTIVLIKQLQEGQNRPEETEETEENPDTPENPETQEALIARTKDLEDKITKAKLESKTSETLKKIASLEQQLADVKDPNKQADLLGRLRKLEAEIASLKSSKKPDVAKTNVPKPAAKPA